MSLRLPALAILALCACTQGKSDEPTKHAPDPGDEQAVPQGDVGSTPEQVTPPATGQVDPAPPMAAPSPDAAPAVKPAVEPAADDTCVTDCVARNQMRAVSPEVIEADCRRECQDP